MKKFNNMESNLLTTSLTAYIEELESEIKQMEENGKRSIFAPGFYTMIGSELIDKIKDMTKKEKV